MRIVKKILKIAFWVSLVLLVVFELLAIRKVPDQVSYGVSFSKFHSDELNLPWKDVYNTILNDLKVKRLRLSAHWPMVEPTQGVYHYDELDYQMNEARTAGASVILVVGRRAPGWPECHDPDWVKGMSVPDREKETLSYIETTVKRYSSYNNLLYWQVENEPFLTSFSKQACGDLDVAFLQQEIALVRKLDPNHKILVTDSGELSTWQGAYTNGDVFGTSVYVYIWSRVFGPMRYPITPAFFRAKQNLITMIDGEKPKILIELSAEPWLLQPIKDAPMSTLLDRMSMDKFNSVLSFAKQSGFDTQYLWGAEWWYWMKQNGHGEFWARAKDLFSTGK